MNEFFFRKKPLPPYGKELLEHSSINQKYPSEIWLFLGPYAWRYAKNHRLARRSVLVLPENTSPDDYVWPVQNSRVLVFDLYTRTADEMMLKQLAWQLLNAGAAVVHLARVFYQPSFTTFFRDGHFHKEKAYATS